MVTKASAELTLKDRLSRLNYLQACKLLGPEGPRLIRKGGAYETSIDEQVTLDEGPFRLTLLDAVVTIRLAAEARDLLQWGCRACTVACEHAGAAFSLIQRIPPTDEQLELSDEQRIGRAHRMGQKRPVQVYVLVTDDTIEERILSTLAAKRSLALAALDPESNVDVVDMTSGIEELKARLEVLLGARAEAPLTKWKGRGRLRRPIASPERSACPWPGDTCLRPHSPSSARCSLASRRPRPTVGRPTCCAAALPSASIRMRAAAQG